MSFSPRLKGDVSCMVYPPGQRHRVAAGRSQNMQRHSLRLNTAHRLTGTRPEAVSSRNISVCFLYDDVEGEAPQMPRRTWFPTPHRQSLWVATPKDALVDLKQIAVLIRGRHRQTVPSTMRYRTHNNNLTVHFNQTQPST